MRLALFQPDIPPNTGTILRLGACLGVPVDIIEPCGFPIGERSFRRAGMDYLDLARITRHLDWPHFLDAIGHRRAGAPRLVLLTTKGSTPYTEFAFRPDDILLLGQEGSGAPAYVHQAADARVRIPLAAGVRSLNIAVAAGIVLGEALRQTDGFPKG